MTPLPHVTLLLLIVNSPISTRPPTDPERGSSHPSLRALLALLALLVSGIQTVVELDGDKLGSMRWCANPLLQKGWDYSITSTSPGVNSDRIHPLRNLIGDRRKHLVFVQMGACCCHVPKPGHACQYSNRPPALAQDLSSYTFLVKMQLDFNCYLFTCP